MENPVGAELPFDNDLNPRLENVRNCALVYDGQRSALVRSGKARHEGRRIALNRALVDGAAHPHILTAGLWALGVELANGQIVDGRGAGNRDRQVDKRRKNDDRPDEETTLPANASPRRWRT